MAYSKSIHGNYGFHPGSKSLLLFDHSRTHITSSSIKDYVAKIKAGKVTALPADDEDDSVNVPEGIIGVLTSSDITVDTITVLSRFLLGTLLINTDEITSEGDDITISVDDPFSINLVGNVKINGVTATPVTFYNLKDLGDVNINEATLTEKMMLYYDLASARWTTTVPINFDFLEHINTDNVSDVNNVLRYNSLTFEWTASQMQASDIDGLDNLIQDSLFFRDMNDVDVAGRSDLFPFIKYNSAGDLYMASNILSADISDLQAKLDEKQDITNPPALSTLSDVDITGLQNGDALVYNDISGFWEPTNIVISLDDLDNVITNDLIEDYVLKYSTTLSSWVSSQLVIDDILNLQTELDNRVPVTQSYTLNDLTNIDLTGLTDGDILVYDQFNDIWKRDILAGIATIDEIPDVDTSNVLTVTSTPKFFVHNDGTSTWEALQLTTDMVFNLDAQLLNKSDVTHNHLLDNLLNMNISGKQDGDTIQFVGGEWIPVPLSGITSLNDIPGVDVTNQSLANNFLKYDGATWRANTIEIADVNNLQNTLDNLPPQTFILNDILDVNTSAKSDGYVLAYDQSIDTWIAKIPSTIPTLDSIGNVDETGLNDGHALIYNGATSNWEPQYLEITDINNLETTLAGKAPLIHYHSLGDLTDVTITGIPSSNSGLMYNGLLNQWENRLIEISDINLLEAILNNKSDITHTHLLNDLSNVSTVGAIAGSILGFNGIYWVPQAASGISSILDIPDVDVPVLVDGYVLGYNATSGNWEGTAPPGITSLNQIPDVEVTTVSVNNVLGYNGTHWVPFSLSGLASIGDIPDVDITNKSAENNILIYDANDDEWKAQTLTIDDVFLLRENITDVLFEQNTNYIQTTTLTTNSQYEIDYKANTNIDYLLCMNTNISAYESNYGIYDEITNIAILPYEITYNKIINNANFFPIIINLYLNYSEVISIFKLVCQNYESSPKEIEIWGHNKAYGAPDKYNFRTDGSGTLLHSDTLNISEETSFYNYTKNTLNTASFSTYSLVILSKQTTSTTYVAFSYILPIHQNINAVEDTNYSIITGANGNPYIENLNLTDSSFIIDLTKLTIHEIYKRLYPVIYSSTDVRIGSLLFDGVNMNITGIETANILQLTDAVNKEYVDTELALKSDVNHNHFLYNLDDVNVLLPITPGSMLYYTGTAWEITSPSGITTINEIPDVDTSNVSSTNNLLIYNIGNSTWEANHYGIDDIDDLRTILNSKINDGEDYLDNLMDVQITAPVFRHVLTYGGTNWTNTNISLQYLDDVDLTTVAANYILIYNSGTSKWTSSPLEITSVNNLEDTLNGKASINHNHQLGTLSDVDITGIINNQILLYNNGTWVPVDRSGINSIGDIPNVDTINKSNTNNVLIYNTTSSNWEANQIEIQYVSGLTAELATKASVIHFHNLFDLSDVNVTTVNNGDLLSYDSGTGTWIPASPAGLTSIGQLPDVDTTGVDHMHVLVYNSALPSWVTSFITTNIINDFDVTAASPTNNVLIYEAGIWTASQLEIADINNLQTILDTKFDVTHSFLLNDLNDVNIDATPTNGDFLTYFNGIWKNLEFNPTGLTTIDQIPDVDITTKSEYNYYLKYNHNDDIWYSHEPIISDIYKLDSSICAIYSQNMNSLTTAVPDYSSIEATYPIIQKYNKKQNPSSYEITQGVFTIINNTGLGITCLWHDDPTLTYIEFTDGYPLRINYEFASSVIINKIYVKTGNAPNDFDTLQVYTFPSLPSISDNSMPPTNGTLLVSASVPTYDFSTLSEIIVDPPYEGLYLAFVFIKLSGTVMDLEKLYVGIKNTDSTDIVLGTDYTISTDPATGYPQLDVITSSLDLWDINLNRLSLYSLYDHVFPVVRSTTNVVIGDIDITSTGPTASTISGLSTPTDNSHAANKEYVDNHITTHSHNVVDLADVDLTGIADNDVLIYNSGTWVVRNYNVSGLQDTDTSLVSATNNVLIYNDTTSIWEASQLEISDINNLQTTLDNYAITGLIELDSLLDVDVSGVADNQLLGYNQGLNKWVPFSISGLGSIGQIPDVDITNKSATNNVLIYDDTTDTWTASQLQISDIFNLDVKLSLEELTDTTFSTVTNGQFIQYDFTNSYWYNSYLYNEINISTNYTVTDTNLIINVDTTTSNIVILLPEAPAINSYLYIKDKFGNSVNNYITINGNGKFINDYYFYNLESNYEAVLLYYNGTNWFTLAKFKSMFDIHLNVTDSPYPIEYNESSMPMCNNQTLTINLTDFSFQPAASIISGVEGNLIDVDTNTSIVVSAQPYYRINYEYETPVAPIYYTYITDYTYTFTIYASNTLIDINESSDDFTGMTFIVTATQSSAVVVASPYKYWSVHIVYDDLVADKTIDEAVFTTKTGTPSPLRIASGDFTLTTNMTDGYPLFNKTIASQQDIKFNLHNISSYELYRRIYPTIRNPGQLFLNSVTISSSPYDVLQTDSVILIDSSTIPITVNLDAAPTGGSYIFVADLGNAETNNITINGNGNTINGNPNVVINENYKSSILYYNGTNWFDFGLGSFTFSSLLGELEDVTLDDTLINNSILKYSSIDSKWHNTNPYYKKIICSFSSSYIITKDTYNYVDTGYVIIYTSTFTFSLTLPEAPLNNTRIIVKDIDGNASTNNITVLPSGADTINSLASDVISTDSLSREFIYTDGDWAVSNLSNNRIYIHTNDVTIFTYVDRNIDLYLPLIPEDHSIITIKDMAGNAKNYNINIFTETTFDIDNFNSTKIYTNYGYIKLYFYSNSWKIINNDRSFFHQISHNLSESSSVIVNYGILNATTPDDSKYPFITNIDTTKTIIYPSLPYNLPTTLNASDITNLSQIVVETPIKDSLVSGNIAYQIASTLFRININYGNSSIFKGITYVNQTAQLDANIKKMRIYGSYNAINMNDFTTTITDMILLKDLDASSTDVYIKNDITDIQYFSIENINPYQYISIVVYENQGNSFTAIGHVGLYTDTYGNPSFNTIENSDFIMSTDPDSGYPLLIKNTTGNESFDININYVSIYELYRRIFPVIRSDGEIQLKNINSSNSTFNIFDYEEKLYISYNDGYLFAVNGLGYLFIKDNLNINSTITYNVADVDQTQICGNYNIIFTTTEYIINYNGTLDIFKLDETGLEISGNVIISNLTNISGTTHGTIAYGDYSFINIDTYIVVRYQGTDVMQLDSSGNLYCPSYTQTNNVFEDISSFISNISTLTFLFDTFNDKFIISYDNALIVEFSSNTLYLNFSITESTAITDYLTPTSSNSYTIGNYTIVASNSFVIFMYNTTNLLKIYNNGLIQIINTSSINTSIDTSGTINDKIIIDSIVQILNIDTSLVITLYGIPIFKLYSTGNLELYAVSVDPAQITSTQADITAFQIANNISTSSTVSNFVMQIINNNMLFSYGSTILMKLYNSGHLELRGNVITEADPNINANMSTTTSQESTSTIEIDIDASNPGNMFISNGSPPSNGSEVARLNMGNDVYMIIPPVSGITGPIFNSAPTYPYLQTTGSEALYVKGKVRSNTGFLYEKTIYIACRPEADNTVDCIFGRIKETNGSRVVIGIGNQLRVIYGNEAGPLAHSNGLTLNNDVVVAVQISLRYGIIAVVNAVQETLLADISTTYDIDAHMALDIGLFQYGNTYGEIYNSSYGFSGRLYELVVYDELHSTSEMTQTIDTLKTKWGI